ncbi:MAG: hypothetical protein JSV86_02080 [Gemmatimonadota bacterium]|nr:MAG: hypothetical protein JSV86_02080 [Gemmatimonadota bacterium]
MKLASNQRVALGLAAAVAAALVVRGLLFSLRGEYLDWDEAMYLLLARSIVEGGGPTLNGLPHTALGPFVPLASAALARLFGLEVLVAQRVVTILSGALVIVPIWYLLRQKASERVSWTAIALLVAWPALIDVTPRLGPIWLHMYAGTEPTYLFFLFLALACGEAALRRRGWSTLALAWVAGSSMACAYLTRAEVVVFAGLYVIARAVGWVRARGDMPGLSVPALAALAFFVTAAPHLHYLHEVSGSWILSGQPPVMRPMAETLQESFRDDRYLGNFMQAWWRLDTNHDYFLNPYWGTPEGVSLEEQKQQFAQVAAATTPVDRGWWGRVWSRATNYGYMLWTLCGPYFLVFVLVGIVARRKEWLPVFGLAGLAASLIVGFYLAVLPRFSLYLIPAFALWAAHGIEAVSERLGGYKDRARYAITGALLAVCLFTVARATTGDLAQALAAVAEDDRRAGEQLSTALPDDARVSHWHPRIAYWAGWEWRPLPLETLDGITHYSANRDVKYVLLSSGGYTPLRAEVPYILLILDDALLEALRLVRSDQSGRHEHPDVLLTEVDPIAGYATGVLSLDVGEAE